MKDLKRGITGYVPVRNIIKHDYCADLAIESLITICDEVIVCDSDSDDGTTKWAKNWAGMVQSVRYLNYPWPNPVGDPWMLQKWLNFIRENARYDSQLTLDADEVLHPDSHERIREGVKRRECLWFKRFNFWKDAWHLVPEGHVCGVNVVRFGPTELMMVSDNPFPDGEPEIRQRAVFDDSLKIWHLGFLRKPEAFFSKSRDMQKFLCNSYDPRLEEAEETGQPWYELSTFPAQLETFHGKHFPLVRPWLKERGCL